MKITSASKKVLASALSAAMVVAFAPTAAFALDASTDTSKWTDDDYIAAGAIAKKTTIGTGITTQYYFTAADLDEALSGDVSYTELAGGETIADYKAICIVKDGAFETAVEGTDYVNDSDAVKLIAGHTVYGKKGTAGATGTVKLLKDVQTNKDYKDKALTASAGAKGLTIDLNGKTLSSYTDKETESAEADLLDVQGGDVTIKDGALVGNDTKANGQVTKRLNAVKITAGTVTVDGVTADEISGNITAEGTDTLGTIDGALTVAKKAVVETAAITKGATVKEAASLTAAVTNSKPNDDKSAKAITVIAKGLTITGKDATVSATAINSKGAATAIAGGIKADGVDGKYKGVKVTAIAKASGEGTYAGVATAVSGAVSVANLAASADSSASVAYGLFSVKSGAGTKDDPYVLDTVDMTEGTVTASGIDNDASIAILAKSAKIAGGNFEGKLHGITDKNIAGGAYTDDPTDYVNTDDYDVSYKDGVYTVGQFKEFAVKSAKGSAGYNFLQGALQTIATGGTVSGITFTEGWDAQKMLNYAKSDVAAEQQLEVVVKTKTYSEKTATDEQKAAKAAIDEAVKADLNYTKDELYKVVTVQVQYTAKGAVDPTVVATIQDMGTKASGLQMIDNVITIEMPSVSDNTAAWQYINGKAAKVAFKDENKNGKHDKTENKLELRYIPSVVTTADPDLEAIKDAAEKGEEVAVEKATQGIDVAQKSKTVKLAKGKTKTQKAVSFKLGASAETALTIAKKSGNSKISVSGQKITLKKGTKKGTYTAKVSLKAAASDEFLAAAKTITVKFVVKK